ncbi:MAG: hypothetical protein Ct9H300mP1_14760 [Planctomycetaceae bacterium]|nr:MAG: hypothetical protein Ct9H300mP1_14760 [Planctomycetaceae bacterium]
MLEFDGHRATPTLSFTVRHLECVAGVVISASHNPPSDNGFKAYWSHGGQVLPPHDTGIVECVAGSTEIPTMAYDQAVADGHITRLGPEIDQAYRRAVLASRPPAPDLQAHDPATLPGLYTPLCGVGASSVLPVLHEAGFVGVELFQPQADPDGDFTAVPDNCPTPNVRRSSRRQSPPPVKMDRSLSWPLTPTPTDLPWPPPTLAVCGE